MQENMQDNITVSDYSEGMALGYKLSGKPHIALRSLYFAWLILAMVISYAILSRYDGSSWDLHTKSAIIWGTVIMIVHMIYRFCVRPFNALAPDIVFVLAYFLFHFGYLILWVFDIVPDIERIFYAPSLYPNVIFIVNIGILSYFFGYEAAQSAKHDESMVVIKSVPPNIWMHLGILIMLMSLLIHVSYILVIGVDKFLTEGYRIAGYIDRYVSDARLWRLGTQIFIFGFALYIIAVSMIYGRLFHGKIGLMVFSIYAGLLLMEGQRTPVAILFMVFIVVRHYLIKPFKLRTLILLFFLLMAGFALIRITREVTSFDISKMTQEIEYASESGEIHWYDPMVEMGASVRAINLTMSVVPDPFPYWYGKTYLNSLLHTIPFVQGALEARLGMTPAKWLTRVVFGPEGSSAGVGFSVAAEGYFNFGYPGVFLQMFLLGFIMRKMYIKFICSCSPSIALVFIMSLGIFIISVRNDSNVVIAPILQALLLAWILKNIFGQTEIMHQVDE